MHDRRVTSNIHIRTASRLHEMQCNIMVKEVIVDSRYPQWIGKSRFEYKRQLVECFRPVAKFE